jgi:hypothetical protein
LYLARIIDKKIGYRYLLRHSYADGDCYRSCDLFDLGSDPSAFIVYPGGNGFYIDTALEDAIADQGVAVSQDDLEAVFLPYLSPHIRRVIDGFDRRSRHQPRADACTPAETLHPFDRYRLHFLKLGQVNQRDLACTPDRFYTTLQHKSRDEIEYDFIAAERRLDSREVALYTYQIFNLQACFSEIFAGRHPEWLDRESMDTFFIKALCRLNDDDRFWAGSDAEPGLRAHLVRYAVMYFDYGFPVRDPFGDLLRDFMNRHRVHRAPESVQISLVESARLFGVSVDELKRMDCPMLTRRYRKVAHKLHPDKGGDQESFVKLSAAYRRLLERKSRH